MNSEFRSSLRSEQLGLFRKSQKWEMKNLEILLFRVFSSLLHLSCDAKRSALRVCYLQICDFAIHHLVSDELLFLPSFIMQCKCFYDCMIYDFAISNF